MERTRAGRSHDRRGSGARTNCVTHTEQSSGHRRSRFAVVVGMSTTHGRPRGPRSAGSSPRTTSAVASAGLLARRSVVLPLAVVGLVVVSGLSASAATSTSTTMCRKAGSVARRAQGIDVPEGVRPHPHHRRHRRPRCGGTGRAGGAAARELRGATGPAGSNGADGAEDSNGIDGATWGAGHERRRRPARGTRRRTAATGAPGGIGPSGEPGERGAAGTSGHPKATQGPQGPSGADGVGPAWLRVSGATAYAAGNDTHGLTSMSLPPGDYLLEASVHVLAPAAAGAPATFSATGRRARTGRS